ncbi:MAG: glycoside hydrolase family 88 protein [Bacteroidales bacterium]|nr:glycoside hydrolase family 88 protein [Bacteroidales bacterium]
MHSLKRRVGKLAVSQIELMDSELGQAQFPRSLHDDGSLQTSDIKYWCVGFFPGTAWYAYELTGKKSMRRIAQKNTLKIDIEQLTDNHDIGFEVWCSYGNAWRLTEDESYLPAIRRGAERLSARFCPTVGCTRSWNRDKGFWVIIDNMMNLELLEMSSRLFGIEDYDKIARTHANTTARNHFREDLSTFHAVIYDEATGKIEKKQTVQGYADDSMWARGQAWGLYGYTMMYRFTRDTSYLAQARGIAKLLIPMLPEDGIPYWDYNDPAKENGEFCPRDASAAAIMASAMLELAGYVENSEEARMLRHTAEKQLLSLASPEYLCKKGECHGFLLKHSTGHRMRGIEVDKPLTYADYYFLEALTRL